MVIELFLEWISGAPLSKRVDAAFALVEGLQRSDLSLEEREDLISAMTALSEDVSPDVRLALAQALGAARFAPRHVALALANDAEQIAAEVLSQSSVLHDVELIDLLQVTAQSGRVAIAGRPWVSEKLSAAIAQHGCNETVYELLNNPGAQILPETLHQIARKFGSHGPIRSSLSERKDLGAHTRLLLVEKLGSALGEFVTCRNWLSQKRSQQVVSEACERASILFAAGTSDDELHTIVRDKIVNDELTLSYLLRATCMGNIALFARALSELSGLEIGRVEAALNAGNKTAFKAVYDRAILPEEAFGLFTEAIYAWRKALTRNDRAANERLSVEVINEVISSYARNTEHVEDELLSMLRRWAADASRHFALSKVERANQAIKQVEAAQMQNLGINEELDMDDLVSQMTEELAAELALDAQLLAREVVEPTEASNDNSAAPAVQETSLEMALLGEIADELGKSPARTKAQGLKAA